MRDGSLMFIQRHPGRSAATNRDAEALWFDRHPISRQVEGTDKLRARSRQGSRTERQHAGITATVSGKHVVTLKSPSTIMFQHVSTCSSTDLHLVHNQILPCEQIRFARSCSYSSQGVWEGPCQLLWCISACHHSVRSRCRRATCNQAVQLTPALCVGA